MRDCLGPGNAAGVIDGAVRAARLLSVLDICIGLTALPVSLGSLSSLQDLRLIGCQAPHARCRRSLGELSMPAIILFTGMWLAECAAGVSGIAV